jgi:DNA modification methylase
VAELVAVFREVKRVLRDDGTLWLNLGDSYWNSNGFARASEEWQRKGRNDAPANDRRLPKHDILKVKDLIGIPWRVAFALQADGWYLRQDIIWCLSGGTRVYARTQKGEMPTTIKDIARLDPATVQLWNGEKWTQLLGMSQSSRNADELEMTLRSGEKIACTPTHKFPTERGLLTADELRPGDRLIRTTLPPPSAPLDSHHMTDDAAWFAGLYLAEGSRSGHTLQIAGHVKESERWERVKAIAAAYGGSATRTIDGNRMDIRVYGKMLHALVDTLVSGTNAKTKHLNPRCWQYSNHFLHALLQGYLSGDGHYDPKNARWRLGFTRNDALAADMRTLAARLDAHLVLNQSHTTLAGKRFPIYRGELRFERSGHWNQKHTEEIVSISKARCRVVYDLGVEDEPHLFALASGILTHNSKPNPMPESVRDRCTKAHEYLFLLSKAPRYYYDADEMREEAIHSGRVVKASDPASAKNGQKGKFGATALGFTQHDTAVGETRNRRDVWTVATKPYKEAHFATFPPDLIRPCIRAGCPPAGKRCDCDEIILSPTGSGEIEDPSMETGRAGMNRPRRENEGSRPITRREQRHEAEEMRASRHKAEMEAECGPAFAHYIRTDKSGARPLPESIRRKFQDRGWITQAPPCPHPIEPAGTVLDPFGGSGTTGEVAASEGRKAILIELNPEYVKLAKNRGGLFCTSNATITGGDSRPVHGLVGETNQEDRT